MVTWGEVGGGCKAQCLIQMAGLFGCSAVGKHLLGDILPLKLCCTPAHSLHRISRNIYEVSTRAQQCKALADVTRWQMSHVGRCHTLAVVTRWQLSHVGSWKLSALPTLCLQPRRAHQVFTLVRCHRCTFHTPHTPHTSHTAGIPPRPVRAAPAVDYELDRVAAHLHQRSQLSPGSAVSRPPDPRHVSW